MERTSEFLADIQRATPNLTSQVHDLKKKKHKEGRHYMLTHHRMMLCDTFNRTVPRRKAVQDAAKLK